MGVNVSSMGSTKAPDSKEQKSQGQKNNSVQSNPDRVTDKMQLKEKNDNSETDSGNNVKIGDKTAEIQDKVLDPINMATGNFICEDADYSLPDMEGDYRLIRRYTTEKDRKNKSLGRAWAFNADTHITVEGNTVIVTLSDDKTAEFIENKGIYTNKKGGTEKYILRVHGEGYLFVDSLNNIQYYYDTKGKIRQTKDKNGNTTEYTYGEYGLEKISLPTGYYLIFSWKDMKVSSVSDNTGRRVNYGYEKGLLTTVTRCDGTKITYTYDENENLRTITDALGNTYLENRYDEKGRVTEQNLAGEARYTFRYDEKTKTNSFTDEGNGTTTYYTYDDRKDIVIIKYPDGSEEKRETDKYGNLAKYIDRCGAVTTYTHDIKGNILSRRDPSGLITHFEYENGRNTKVWDNDKRQTIYKYDEKGNIIERRTLLDSSTGKENIVTFEYDSYGRITKTIENFTIITLYGYKGTFPRPCRITEPNGIVIIQKYDAAGRLMEKNTEGIIETYTYTEYNKLKTYTDSEGGKTSYYYDDVWRQIKKVSPSQNRTGTIKDAGITYEYDILDRLISETDECGRKTEYKRNINGDIVSIRRCGENDYNEENCLEESIVYFYDKNNRLIGKQTGSLGTESYKNDACGRIISKSLYADNKGYTYERDKSGRIIKVIDPYGNITDKYIYDFYGNVVCHMHSPKVMKSIAEAEATGKDTSMYPGDRYTYNAVGQMITKMELLSIDEDGTPLYSITSYIYDEFGRLITEKTYVNPQSHMGRPKGESRIIQRKYDDCGNLIEITDSTGAAASYEYDKYGRMVTETTLQDNEKSRIIKYVYDRCGRTVNRKVFEKRKVDEPQKSDFKRRTGNRFLESRKEPELNNNIEILIEDTEYRYDKSGNLIKAVMPEGLISTAKYLTIEYAYDESGRKISVTAYDAKDSDHKRINTYKYDEYGYVSERIENGIRVLYENDAFGNILKEKYADGGTISYQYDVLGKCTRIITPEENRRLGKDALGTVTEYDLCGRPVKIISPNGTILEENTYDSSGNILVQKKPDKESITYGYDAGGRIIYSVTAAGVRREYSYDALGNIAAQALGDETAYFKNDVWGHLTEVKAAEDITETYEYDKFGSITAAVDGEGRRREYHRDIRGNTDRITYADGSMETFEYNAFGRLVSKTHRSGKKTEYEYDVFGNIVMIKGQSAKDVCNYKYSRDGSLETAEGGGIKYTYEYDDCGRLKAKKACGRTLVSYNYDMNGNKKSVTDAAGKTTCYEYDILNRLLRISECDRILAEYEYTPGGKVSKVVCGDIVTGYKYDNDGRYAGIRVSVGENVISDIRYGYDDKGNCIKKENYVNGVNAVTNYKYDGIGRLVGEVRPGIRESYKYDRAGNRVSRITDNGITESYNYNEVNELLSIESSKRDGTSNGIREFTYDADGNMISDGKGIYSYDSMNRMAEAVMNDGSKFVCRYDAEGLRHETEENGRLIKFIYSGRDAVCEEEEERGYKRYIRGNGSLVASDSEQARTYYHYACDSLGSICSVIAGNEYEFNGFDGDVKKRILCSYEHDAFGNRINEEESIENRYGFTGETYDGITGQYYLRARYYMPEIGRFTQADTYHGDGLNLYVYARNNPVMYVDPSGHECGKPEIDESGSGSLWKPTIKKNDLWNKGKLKEHYNKHGIPEFGAKSSKEYSEMAYEFGTRRSDSIIEVIEGAYVYRYQPSTNNIFVGTLKGGKIKSFYKWDGRDDDVVIETLKRLEKI